MPTATATAPGLRQRKSAVRPMKPPIQHFVIVSSGAHECFWSDPAFRDKCYTAERKLAPDDWVFIDLSRRERQLDEKSLSALGHIFFVLDNEKGAKIGLVLNDQDRKKLDDVRMCDLFTIFISFEELQKHFSHTDFTFL